MAHLLIVGDIKSCSFNSVAIAIGECPALADVIDKWKELAKHLNTDKVKKMELQERLNLGKTKIICVPEELMIEWRSRNAEDATLKKFCEALEATGLHSTATYLIKKFVLTEKVDSGKSKDIKENKVASISDIESEGHQDVLEYVSLEIGDTDAYDIWPGENITEMVRPKKPMDFPDDGFHLPKDTSKGSALVINVIKYDPKTNFKSRVKGSSQDATHLDNMLKELGYHDVDIYNNPFEIYTQSVIKAPLLVFKRKCIKNIVCSLVVFIGCHGINGSLEMSDGSSLDIFKDVVYLFNTKNAPKLQNIPRSCSTFSKRTMQLFAFPQFLATLQCVMS